MNNEEEDGVEFYLNVCFDVLYGILQFGDRHPLTKVEQVGRCFHWIIEKYFCRVPFLRLDLTLQPKFVFVLKNFQPNFSI